MGAMLANHVRPPMLLIQPDSGHYRVVSRQCCEVTHCLVFNSAIVRPGIDGRFAVGSKIIGCATYLALSLRSLNRMAFAISRARRVSAPTSCRAGCRTEAVSAGK